MTGEQYYRAHMGTAQDLGIAVNFVPWNVLSHIEQAQWEELAYEQTLRDRPLPNPVESDRLQSNEKGF